VLADPTGAEEGLIGSSITTAVCVDGSVYGDRVTFLLGIPSSKLYSDSVLFCHATAVSVWPARRAVVWG
jgi:hypothetical protein